MRSWRFKLQLAVLLASLAFILAILGVYAYIGISYSQGQGLPSDRRQLVSIARQLDRAYRRRLQLWCAQSKSSDSIQDDAFPPRGGAPSGFTMPPASMAGAYRSSDAEMLAIWHFRPDRPSSQGPPPSGPPAPPGEPFSGGAPRSASGAGHAPEPGAGSRSVGNSGEAGPQRERFAPPNGEGPREERGRFGPRGRRMFMMPPRERDALVRLSEQAVRQRSGTYELLSRPDSEIFLYAQPLWDGPKIMGTVWALRWLRETPVGALSVWALPAVIGAALVGMSVALWTAVNLQRDLLGMQAGLELGREMVASLMPAETLQVEDYEIARRVDPATEVGGDFYNLFPAGSGRIAVVVGDVAGTGIAAALAMAVVTTLLEEYARAGLSPSAVMMKVNERLQVRLRARKTFATAVYGRLDPAAHTLSLCNAGQTPCVWLRPGDPARYVKLTGTPLGRIGPMTYQEEVLELAVGDTLVFSTDGFVEMRNGDETPLGYDGWLALVDKHRDERPGGMVEQLFAAVGGKPPPRNGRDDLTLLVLRRSR